MQPLGRCLQKTQRALRTSSLSPELTANFPRRPRWLPGAAVVPRPVPWATNPPQGRLASPSALLPSGVELLPPTLYQAPPSTPEHHAGLLALLRGKHGPRGPCDACRGPDRPHSLGHAACTQPGKLGAAVRAACQGRGPTLPSPTDGSPRRGTWRRLGGASLLPTGTHGRGHGRGRRAAEEQGAGRAGAEGLDRASAEPGGAVASGSSAVCEPTGASVVCAAPPSFQIQERVSNAARGHCAGQTAGQDTGPAA